MTNPKFIYLQPECCADDAYGRLWCEDPNPVDCEDGKDWTKYVNFAELEKAIDYEKITDFIALELRALGELIEREELAGNSVKISNLQHEQVAFKVVLDKINSGALGIDD